MIKCGMGILWFTDTPPEHFKLCDGAAISRTSYAALFALIGTSFGVGDGSSTFNLPDFKGRSPVGTGQGSGLSNRILASKFGEESHALTSAENGQHTHTGPSHAHQLYIAEPGSGSAAAIVASATALNPSWNTIYGTTMDGAGATGSSGSGTAHNTMQPSLCINFCIAYEDVVESPQEVVWDTTQFNALLSALTEE